MEVCSCLYQSYRVENYSKKSEKGSRSSTASSSQTQSQLHCHLECLLEIFFVFRPINRDSTYQEGLFNTNRLSCCRYPVNHMLPGWNHQRAICFPSSWCSLKQSIDGHVHRFGNALATSRNIYYTRMCVNKFLLPSGSGSCWEW